MVHAEAEEILFQKTHLSPRLSPKVILKSAWQGGDEGHDQSGNCVEQPAADEVTMEPKIDFRIQCMYITCRS